MYGIETSTNHLNDTNINWAGLNDPSTWPQFAGRYFINAPVTFGHGELANSPYTSLRGILPIQGGNPDRQAVAGRDGYLFGYSDALALCRRIESCLRTGEISLALTGGVLVFLEVKTGTALSVDYWAGWASAITSYVCTVPVPALPFRPCIICDFVPTPNLAGSYSPDPNVRSCLDAASGFYTRSPIYCHGFWARTPANGSVQLFPVPPFPKFEDYNQPFADTKIKVNIVLWRFAPPTFVQVLNPSDAGLSAPSDLIALPDMLQVNTAFSLTAIALPNPSSYRTVGVDCDTVVTVATAAGLSGATTALADVAGIGVSFTGRYAGPHTNALQLAEIKTLSGAHLRIVTIKQRMRIVGGATVGVNGNCTQAQVLNYLNNFGAADGQEAFTSAFGYNQPAHTPVYFGIDYDFGDSAQERQALRTYFTGIATGYQNYLNAQPKDGEKRPYAIGVYGTNLTLDYCYQNGLANYFWKAAANYGRATNRPLYGATNLWQEGLEPQAIGALASNHFDVDVAWTDEGSWLWRDDDITDFPPLGHVAAVIAG